MVFLDHSVQCGVDLFVISICKVSKLESRVSDCIAMECVDCCSGSLFESDLSIGKWPSLVQQVRFTLQYRQ